MLKVLHWRPLQFDEDFQEWISLLLSLTRVITAPVLAECLQEVLSQQYTVTRKYHNYVSYDFYVCFACKCTMYYFFFPCEDNWTGKSKSKTIAGGPIS